MILVEAVLGNRNEPKWQALLASAKIDFLELDQWESQKSRLRKRTVSDQELAISLERGMHIHDGDVLHWQADSYCAVVARIDVREVMVVDLTELSRLDPVLAMRTCIEIGHAMGNQHWPALVKNNKVYVPLVLARKVMDSVMRTHAFENIAYEFVPGREVIPYLAPHETRRLFGGAEGIAHAHADSHGQIRK
ncbi:MAG: urease accessory protein UreE [Beijerinckiaceae bacterium]|nr:urease accessory protein UreE [Beijerinckiaceae bacterium]